MRMVKLVTTLLYYDGIQVFEGKDESGDRYLGAMIDSELDADRYLVTDASPEHLGALRAGTRDLRAVLLECSYDGWYLARIGDNFAAPFAPEPQQGALLDYDYLPEAGVLLAEYEDGIGGSAVEQPRSRAF